jgi:lysophospholipase L1-like esterase
VLLVVASAGTLAVALAVGRACRRRGDLLPAWAALATTLLCVVLFVAAETWFSFHDVDPFAGYRAWGHRRSLLLGFEADANYHWEAAGATYTTDARGFRVHLRDVDWPNAAGTRIFALGESSTFGYGLGDDATWVHRLEGLVRSATHDEHVEVMNAATNGFRSLQTMLHLYVRVLPYHPDYVLFYQGVNDVGAVRLPRDSVMPLTEAAVFFDSLRTVQWRAYPHSNIYARTLTALHVSTVLQRLWPRWFVTAPARAAVPAGDAARPDPATIQRENGEQFAENVVTMIDMCRRAGAVPVIMTFLHNPAHFGPEGSAGIRYHNVLMRELAAREKVALIDLENEFAAVPDKAAYFFADGYHPNDKGAAFIAAAAAPHVAALLERR